jgi:FAD/FMN-containing dehydrogenase
MLTLEYNGKSWKKHRQAVAAICKSMKQAHRDQIGPLPVWEAPREVSSGLAGLNRVVEVVTHEFTAWVEPNATMEMLVRSTMKRQVAMAMKLIPNVSAISKTTTVAEAFATATCGSSSFRLGAFDCAVLSLEAVLRDGQYLEAKVGDCDADLLLEKIRASPSLAAITLFQLALVPATECVELAYWPVSSIEGAIHRMKVGVPNSLVLDEQAMDETIEFVDCIVFHSKSAVVITGRYTSAAAYENMTRFAEGDSFVQHAKSIYTALGHEKGPKRESIPLIDYLFRYHACTAAPLRVKRRSEDRRDSLMPEDPGGASEDVALVARSVAPYVRSLYDSNPIGAVIITPVEPHSRLGVRRFGTETSADKTRWNVRMLHPAVT